MTKRGGLTSKEAKLKLKQYGLNEAVQRSHNSAMVMYASKFKSPLVILLAFAAALAFSLGQGISSIIILIIIFLSTTLDFANSYRSQKAAEALQKSVRVNTTVLRDGEPRRVPLINIVPGDVVLIEAGSVIPADGQVIQGNDLAIDESALTGESFPVAKMPEDKVYMGSSVSNGVGQILITQTGTRTEFAHIAASLQQNDTSEFDREINRFSMLVMRISIILVLFTMAMNILQGDDAKQTLLFAAALAVGMTPELLPLIVTLNLTRGSLRMAKKGVIVKHQSAIHNFGSMDVLCTDKTGTLTENKISVARTTDYHGTDAAIVLERAAVACQYTTSYASPLDIAIEKAYGGAVKGYRREQEIPYDFQRKRESVVVHTSNQHLMITKGAPDGMMDILASYLDKDGVARRLNAVGLAKISQQYQNLSRSGYHTLMIAQKVVEDVRDYDPTDEAAMTFVGFVAFIDPPKESAAASLRKLHTNGIEIKIISGDDPLVSQRVVSELGLEIKGILTGDKIAKMSRLQLRRAVEHTTIFARVNPSQKMAIIEEIRKRGHVVGYMGDGINDAPSLRAADVGISVNNAVDVAKDTADLILLRKSLEVLNDGVVEGRKTFVNVMKYLKMSLNTNFGDMVSMSIASFFLNFAPMTVTQLLINNLLYDASQFAIPSDNVDTDEIQHPRKFDISAMKKFMVVFGLLSTSFDLITFYIMLNIFHVSEHGFQTGWFIESLLTQILVVFIVRTRHIPFVQSRPSGRLVASILGVVVVAFAFLYSGFGKYFDLIVPHLAFVGVIAVLVTIYLFVVEGVKHLFYKIVGDKI